MQVEGGMQHLDPAHLETDLSPRYARSFRRVLIHGSSRGRKIEAEFDNERVRTPARGVILRVWSRHNASAIRDSVLVAIDGGRGPLSGEPTKGPVSNEPPEDALRKVERDRNGTIALLALLAVCALAIGVVLLHNFTSQDPDSAFSRLFLFCFCENKWIAFVLYGVAVAVAVFFAGPRIFPPVEISERSNWQRVRGKLLGLGVVTFVFNAAVEVIANGLP